MSTTFEIPEWLVEQSAPPPPVDDHRVEGLVNGFIAGKQDAPFDAPDACSVEAAVAWAHALPYAVTLYLYDEA
ncbi:MAG TPA: hypothetical protein VGM96_19430 [Reyranella sp.]|jgi:hypothetical protein